MTLLIPGVGGSVGNAAIQLARAQGAGRIITSAGRGEKADQARRLGYGDVIDLSQETLSEGVMRLTDGEGVDAALDSIGGDITGEALKSVRPGGRVIHMGYPGGTDLNLNSLTLIWSSKGSGATTSIEGFNMYFQPPEAFGEAWGVILKLLTDGTVKPVVDRTYPLAQAGEATRHLIEDRPFGKVVLTVSDA